jgi:hypothetical protein
MTQNLVLADDLNRADAMEFEARHAADQLQPRCHAAKDGECAWSECPQIRDGEPLASGRHCPIDTEQEQS